LLPFAKANGLTYTQQMDNAECWPRFRQSWVNLGDLIPLNPYLSGSSENVYHFSSRSIFVDQDWEAQERRQDLGRRSLVLCFRLGGLNQPL
jgi:hypothetical protein